MRAEAGRPNTEDASDDMPQSLSTLRGRRLYLGSAALLVVGLLAALLVFVTAGRSVDDSVVAYRMEDGRAVPVTLARSAPDVRLLEAEGGRANLAAAEMNDWIGSLWRGRRLACVVAALSVALAGLCAWVARLMVGPPHA